MRSKEARSPGRALVPPGLALVPHRPARDRGGRRHRHPGDRREDLSTAWWSTTTRKARRSCRPSAASSTPASSAFARRLAHPQRLDPRGADGYRAGQPARQHPPDRRPPHAGGLDQSCSSAGAPLYEATLITAEHRSLVVRDTRRGPKLENGRVRLPPAEMEIRMDPEYLSFLQREKHHGLELLFKKAISVC